jgi:hypothetical protein
MVLTVHIDRWAFEKMGYDNKQLKELMKLLYGFGGKRIEPVRLITLLISFDTPQNPPHRIHKI